jgi:hypothetical protein
MGHLHRVKDLFDPQSERSLSRVVARALRKTEPQPTRRYHTMWDLDVLLHKLRKDYGDNDRLSDGELQTKTMMLIMICSACRLAGLARIELPIPTEVTDSTIWLRTVTKQKATVRETVVIRVVTETSLCPVRTTRAWLPRRASLGPGKLFLPSVWHEKHVQTGDMLKASDIAEKFKAMLRCAGIATTYSAYSIKHAVITKLFRAGATDAQVVDFGRWAKDSKTPRTWYNIETLEKDWLGTLVVANILEQSEDEAMEGLDAQYLPPTRSAEQAGARNAAEKWLCTPLPL